MRTLPPLLICLCFLLAITVCSASPLHIVDDLGRHLTLARSPLRIVSLEPSVTEVLYSVGASNKLVADDISSDYPPAAKQMIHVNGVSPSREMMLALKPDLVILFDQTFTVQKADAWQTLYNTPVYVTNASTYQGVVDDIKRLGALTGDVSDTESTVNRMVKAANHVSDQVRGKPIVSVFIEIWNRPLMTAGRGTFIDDLVKKSGGVDVASSHVSGYPTYSPEKLVDDNPDVIITGTQQTKVIRVPAGTLSSLHLRAEKLGSIYGVPDDWTVRPGPRLALGLEAIADLLHPTTLSH